MQHRFSLEILSMMLTKAIVTGQFLIRKLKVREILLLSTQRHIQLRIAHDKRKREANQLILEFLMINSGQSKALSTL